MKLMALDPRKARFTRSMLRCWKVGHISSWILPSVLVKCAGPVIVANYMFEPLICAFLSLHSHSLSSSFDSELWLLRLVIQLQNQEY